MFSDSILEDQQNAVLRRRYVYETVSQDGGVLDVSPVLVSPPKTRQELDEMHQIYMASRSKCTKMERAVDLLDELCSLDVLQLDGVLRTELLDGKTLSHLCIVVCP